MNYIHYRSNTQNWRLADENDLEEYSLFDGQIVREYEPDMKSRTTWNSLLRPKAVDVICSRSKQAFHHAGNIRYRITIEMNRKRYQSTTCREEKSRMIKGIISFFYNECGHGRFLKFDQTTKRWRVLTDEEAHLKVAHALRSNKEATMKLSKKKPAEKVLTKEADVTVAKPVHDVPTDPNASLGEVHEKMPVEEFTMDFSIIDEIGNDPVFEAELFLHSATARIL
jgi:hypothetical protein